ncbi:MAG: phosphate butyryltransferase [Clostridiales bacterium]|jgi:phosphate butyryltransferase|nr:phosphate butyryltransferase [Clostridiales bacterium]
MIFKDFNTLKEMALAKKGRTIAVAAAEDAHTLEAVRDAANLLGAGYYLAGRPDEIKRICDEIGFPVPEAAVIHADNDAEAAAAAVSLVREGKAHTIMKGGLQTPVLLKACLNKDTGIRSGGIMSHLTVLECPAYHKLLFMTDGGMNPYPDLSQKQAILENAVDYMSALGYENPNVAALAAAETVSDKMPETGDAAALAAMNRNGGITGCTVEGPLSFDLAVSRESAAIKGVDSAVSGDVDLLLVPNIAVGNIMSKALLYLGGAKMAGCVLGAKAPVILVSRGATAEEKLLSIMMGLLGARS